MILTLEVAGFDDACDIAQDILEDAARSIREALNDTGQTAQILLRGDSLADFF